MGGKIEKFDFARNGPGMGGESAGNRFGMSFVTHGPILGALAPVVGSRWAGFRGCTVAGRMK